MSQALVINSGRLERVGATTASEKLLLTLGTAGGLDVEAAGALGLATGTPTATSVEIGSGGAGLPITLGAGGPGGSLTTVAGDLTVSGNEIVVGSTTFQGNTIIGDTITDTLKFGGVIINRTVAPASANESLLFQAEFNHVILVNTSTAETVGGDLTIQAAEGGGASGAAVGGDGGFVYMLGGLGGGGDAIFGGGDGGAAVLNSGVGGAGTAAQLAGAGGDILITAAGAGADGGGGGAVGGDVTIAAGLGTGAFADGVINIGATNTSAINIGTAAIGTDVFHNKVADGSTGLAIVQLNIGRSQNGTSGGAANAVGAYAIGVNVDPMTAITVTEPLRNLQDVLEAMDVAIAASGGTPSLDTVMTTGTPDNTVTLAAGAGIGEAISLTAAAGAVGAGANGFAGGLVLYVAGAGGANDGATDDGGVGGAVTVTGGAGGAATGAGRTGGLGGTLSVTAGAGGNSAVFGGGAGGALNLAAGDGGTGTFQGNGGDLNLSSGTSQSSNGTAGNINITPGVGVSSDGEINILTPDVLTDSVIRIGPTVANPANYVTTQLTGQLDIRLGATTGGIPLDITNGFQNPNSVNNPSLRISHTAGTATTASAEAAARITSVTAGTTGDPRYPLLLDQATRAETTNYGEFIQMRSSGTGADEVSIFLGDGTPSALVTEGEVGSLFIDAVGAALYMKTAGPSTWTAFATGGAATLQSAYDGGQTITTNTTAAAVRVEHTDASGTNHLMELVQTPSAALAGDALNISTGGTSTGRGLFLNNAGAGNAIEIQDGGVTLFSISATGSTTLTTNAALTPGSVTIESRLSTAGTSGDVTLQTVGTTGSADAGDVFIGALGTGGGEAGGVEIHTGTTAYSTPANGSINFNAGPTLANGTAGAIIGTVAVGTGNTAVGGAVSFTAGEGGAGAGGIPSPDGGPASLTAGAGGVGAGATFAGGVGGAASLIGAVGGASGVSGVAGVGGAVIITAGAAGATSGTGAAGGDVTITTGAGTGGLASGTLSLGASIVAVTTPTETRATGLDFSEVISMTSTGTDAAAASILLGSDDPNGATAVNAGDLGSLFIDTVNFDLYMKTAASTWTAFATGGAAETLQQTYDAGATTIAIDTVTSATAIAISNAANANGNLTLSQTFVGGGTALGVTMGASATGNAIDVTMTTGAAGSAVNITDATETTRLNLADLQASQNFTHATDNNASTTLAAGFSISVAPGDGSNTVAGVGGAGGAVNVTPGDGGTGSGANLGGAGGAYGATGGTGGLSVTGQSGPGGDMTMQGGVGGALPAAGTFAGNGGSSTTVGGIGGANAIAALAGGVGGLGRLTGGVGGANTNATGTAGAGGTVQITGGAAGSTSGTGAAGGNVVIRGGALSGAAADGSVVIGDFNTTAVSVGGSLNGLTSTFFGAETTPSISWALPIVLDSDVGTVAGMGIYVTDGDPSGVISAQGGSLALRDDGEVWVNTSAGVGTTWSMLAAAGGNTLQQAYVAGNTISVTTAEGSITFSNSTDVTDVLSIDRTFVGAGSGIDIDMGPGAEAVTGDALNITMGTAATGRGLFLNNSGTGNAVQIQDGGGDVLVVTAAGGVAITPTSAQNLDVTLSGVGNFTVTTGSTGGITSVAGTGNTSFSSQGVAAASILETRLNAAGIAGDVTVRAIATNAGATSGDVFVGAIATVGTAGGVEIRAGGTAFTAPTAGTVRIISESLDIVFDARGMTTPITLNESGDLDLDGAFTATSIVGALNELISGTAPSNTTVTGTSAEVLATGAPAAFNTTNGVIEGDANSGDTRESTIGLVLVGVGSAASVDILIAGEMAIPDAQWDAAPGAGASGSLVYLSDTVGNVTTTAPGGASRVMKLGLITFADASANTTRVLVPVPDSVKL